MSLAQKRRRKLRADATARASRDYAQTLAMPMEKWAETARLYAAPRTLSDEEANEIGAVLRNFALEWSSKPYIWDGR